MAHVILVSAQGPNPSFYLFWGTFIRLGGLLGQGLELGPGLDNTWSCYLYSLQGGHDPDQEGSPCGGEAVQ